MTLEEASGFQPAFSLLKNVFIRSDKKAAVNAGVMRGGSIHRRQKIYIVLFEGLLMFS